MRMCSKTRSPAVNAKKTIVYDSKDEDTIIEGKLNTRFSDDPELNTLNRRSRDYEFDYGSILPIIAFNPDDGLLVGISGGYFGYGFKKEPYSSHHAFVGQYAIATSGFSLDYKGEYIDLFGDWELGLQARYQAPLYAINFYGLGNDTENPEVDGDKEPDFNRVRQERAAISPTIQYRINDNSLFSFGPVFDFYDVDSTAGRFIAEVGPSLNPDLFDGQQFAGARAVLDFQNNDDPAFPANGIGFYLEAGWLIQLNNTDKDFAYLNSSLSYYKNLDPQRKVVFGTRVGVQHRFNNNFEFYQAATLGGIGPNSNFRGFRRDRFSGRTAFWQNIDLRWKILTSGNKKVPFSFGILGGFDHGRVWLSGEFKF